MRSLELSEPVVSAKLRVRESKSNRSLKKHATSVRFKIKTSEKRQEAGRQNEATPGEEGKLSMRMQYLCYKTVKCFVSIGFISHYYILEFNSELEILTHSSEEHGFPMRVVADHIIFSPPPQNISRPLTDGGIITNPHPSLYISPPSPTVVPYVHITCYSQLSLKISHLTNDGIILYPTPAVR